MSAFRHEAYLYRDESEWIAGALPFIEEAIASDVPIMVAVSSDRIETLTTQLGAGASEVEFVAMESAGKNPGRIISLWSDFVDHHGSARQLRGIGEPVWPGRRPDELVECELHEQLLNVAFAGRPLQLRCPYDASALPDDVIEASLRSHPFVCDGSRETRASANERFASRPSADGPLSRQSEAVQSMHLEHEHDLLALRRFLDDASRPWITDAARRGDFVLAITEIATNSLEHCGTGTAYIWNESGRVMCDVVDAGRIKDPMVGRRRATPSSERGRGVWLANQMCDLVQIRSSDAGTIVRLVVELDASTAAVTI